MKEALYYSKEKNEQVICSLCPHRCHIEAGRTGICKVRRNDMGTLMADTYGIIASSALDPIEKKPLYHFNPGKMIYSIGSYSCNLKCIFCQNHEISQVIPQNIDRYRLIFPDEVVSRAGIHQNCIGIAYTYNEPLISFEYMHNIARISKENKLKNVMVTNGYINAEPLTELIQFMDAFNVDLKAFSNEFYKKHAGGSLIPVLETLKTIRKNGRHLEVTFLVIPGLNDDEKTASQMFHWIASELGKDTVLHLSRYYPSYKLTNPATPQDTLFRFYDLAAQQLSYVYIGNVPFSPMGHNTVCLKCSAILIKRSGYNIAVSGIDKTGKCINCGFDTGILMS